jgi:hypothetical protein
MDRPKLYRRIQDAPEGACVGLNPTCTPGDQRYEPAREFVLPITWGATNSQPRVDGVDDTESLGREIRSGLFGFLGTWDHGRRVAAAQDSPCVKQMGGLLRQIARSPIETLWTLRPTAKCTEYKPQMNAAFKRQFFARKTPLRQLGGGDENAACNLKTQDLRDRQSRCGKRHQAISSRSMPRPGPFWRGRCRIQGPFGRGPAA